MLAYYNQDPSEALASKFTTIVTNWQAKYINWDNPHKFSIIKSQYFDVK